MSEKPRYRIRAFRRSDNGSPIGNGYDLSGGMRDAVRVKHEFSKWLRDGQFRYTGSIRDEHDKCGVRRSMLHEWESRVVEARNERDQWKRRAENAERTLREIEDNNGERPILAQLVDWTPHPLLGDILGNKEHS